MAHGDWLDSGHLTQVAYWRSFRLLDAATSTSSGSWVDARGFRRMTVDVRLAGGTATIQLRGSNDLTKPDTSTDGLQIGANVTADGLTSIDLPIRWIKGIVSAYTSGTITVNVQMSNP